MQNLKANLQKIFSTILWGNSVALAWTWGIGLFLSVQLAIQFGFKALIMFASIDAFGLALFGIINSRIIKEYPSAESFEQRFLDKASRFKLAFFFYQFLALTLTLYCCLKYVTLPLGILSVLVAGVFFGAVIFLGEEFPIARIKYSHGVMGLLVFGALAILLNSSIFDTKALFSAALSTNDFGLKAELAFNKEYLSWLDPFWNYSPLYKFNSGLAEFGFWVPVFLGFLCGPWLDLQHWQRVIQIKKENLSPTITYIIGGVLFWLIMMADGMLAIACFERGYDFFDQVIPGLSNIAPDSLLYSVKNTVTSFLMANNTSLLGCYLLFVGLSALSTFDSGYIAYRWYSEYLLKDSKSLFFSLVPIKIFSSPIPAFLICTSTAIATLHFSEVGKFVSKFDPSLDMFFRIELEYYLAFYAAFFLIYTVAFFRDISSKLENKFFSSLKLFSTALSGLAVFGIGYFAENTIIMALGSAIPFIYGWFTIPKQEIVIITNNGNDGIQNTETKLIPQNPNSGLSAELMDPSFFNGTPIDTIPSGAKPVGIKGCYIKDSWFVHSFIPTYQDTNSVGNVYFAMYLMWVGKTRELFFMHTMPDFNPKTSEYLILTRSIEHKFLKEVREFDEVSIHIKISDYNRKFVTIEHKILDTKGDLVGKGKQVLMFVSSKNYALIDLPSQVQQVYLKYLDEVKI